MTQTSEFLATGRVLAILVATVGCDRISLLARLAETENSNATDRDPGMSLTAPVRYRCRQQKLHPNLSHTSGRVGRVGMFRGKWRKEFRTQFFRRKTAMAQVGTANTYELSPISQIGPPGNRSGWSSGWRTDSAGPRFTFSSARIPLWWLRPQGNTWSPGQRRGHRPACLKIID